MKAFLEEYGLIVVVCIAFAVLVALVVWATKKGADSSTATINGFTNKATSVMEGNGVNLGESEDIGQGCTHKDEKKADGTDGADGKCDLCGATM